MTFRWSFLSLLFFSGITAQTSGELADYAAFHHQKLEDFEYFMRITPTVIASEAGLRKMVFEAGDDNVGIEESAEEPGKIGEIFVFKTIEDPQQIFAEWQRHLSVMKSTPGLNFVNAIYNDGQSKHTLDHPDQLLKLLTLKDRSDELNYGVRFRKGNVFHSLFVVQGHNFVFTVHHRN